jgi:2-aminoadipate transaminase
LREWVAQHLAAQGLAVRPEQVLITTGSQQGLDLAGKVLIDAGAPVAVETPTYLGALQAFAPDEPHFVSLDGDDDGPLPDSFRTLAQRAPGARFAYLLPNFQNPTGRVIPRARREALVHAARAAGVPLVEDNPYGDLWFDEAPPPAMASWWPEGSVYLGSFPKLLQAKQASDLHTPSFNQRVVHEVVRNGFLNEHVPTIRARYRAQRDAMEAALRRHMPDGTTWRAPQGGMFFWLRLPTGLDAMALLEPAVAAGVAFVPGAPFYAHAPDPRALRLSFVTLSPDDIEAGVTALGTVLHEALNALPVATP